jgi:hypothetical protein
MLEDRLRQAVQRLNPSAPDAEMIGQRHNATTPQRHNAKAQSRKETRM